MWLPQPRIQTSCLACRVQVTHLVIAAAHSPTFRSRLSNCTDPRAQTLPTVKCASCQFRAAKAQHHDHASPCMSSSTSAQKACRGKPTTLE